MNKKLLYIFAFVFTCLSVAAQSTSQTITATGSGTFTVPCGVTSLSVEVWGGGGGGGDAKTSYALAGGGSGGAYTKNTISVTSGASYNYFVATGGNSGANGQDSWFVSNATLKAVGGKGAVVCTTGFGSGASAVTSGNIGGTTNTYGAVGENARVRFLFFTSGGGGNGGNGGNGGARIVDFLGFVSATNGNNGAQPGGGGSGAYTNDGTLKVGGKGGDGQIIITYTLPRPTANAGADFNITCVTNPSGSSIGMTAVSGVTYSWSPTAGLSNASIANPTANPSSTTTYTLTAIDACGYSNTDQVTVNVNKTIPVANAGADFNITCNTNPSGSTLGVAAVAGVTYSWSPATGLSSASIANPTANPSTTTTYTVTATNTASGCTATDAVVVTVDKTIPVANAGADFNITCTTNPSGSTIGVAAVTGVTYSWSPATGLSSASIANPTANPSSTTTYTLTATNTASGCTATDAVVVTVNKTIPVANAGADFNITCTTNPSGSTVGVAAVAGVTYSWSPATGLSSASIANPTANPSTTTTYTVTATNTASGCTATDAVVVTVNKPIPSAPLISTIFGTSCTSNTGSIELKGLPEDSWTLTPYLSGVAQATISGAGTSTTVPNLTIGTYTFIVSNGTCSSTTSADAVVTDNSTTTWNGTTWSNLVPDESKIAIISGNYDMSKLANIDACSIIINSPAKITVAANKFLTIQNDLTVNSGATLDVLNQGSLVMLNDSGVVTNNGTTTIRKVTTPYEKFDYTYWSAPTDTTIGGALSAWRQDYSFEFRTANFSDVLNGGDGFDDNRDDWVRVSQVTPMSAGKGYAIMAPTTGTFPTTREVVFSGKVNNGLITQNVFLSANDLSDTDDKNLLGNPYPSAISANMFLAANPSLQGTIYLWTHVGNISVSNPGPDLLNFKSDDYAMYNFSGGVGVGVGVAPEGGNSANASNAIPAGFIASGQGFFVGVDYNSTIVFNNSMRSKSFDNTNFYRAADETETSEKDRIWLNLQNKDGMFSQQLIGYFDNATLGFDRGYDGIVSKTSNYVSFYSFIDQDIYRIQGRPAFNENDTVPLGYSSAVSDTFTIAIDTKEGKLNNRSTNIYLEDKLLNVIYDLKQGPYSFTTAKGTFNDRFVLRYLRPTLGTNDLEALVNEVKVALNNNQIQISSPIETMKEVRVYDVLGKLIIERKNVNSNELTIPTRAISQQTLLINITLTNGQKVTRKMIF